MKLKISIVLLLFCNDMIYGHGTTKDHSITIFVHGTYLMRKLWQYSHYRPLIYCPQGLSLAKHLPAHYHFYKLVHGCVSCDPHNYSVDQFYIFGWPSEHVNDHTRHEAAGVLVEQISEVVVDYYLQY